MTDTELGLLLIHPAVTTTPDKVVQAVDQAALNDVKIVDQFLINKINDESIKLEDEKYNVIYYLTPETTETMKFPVKLIPKLHKALKTGGKLYGLCNAYKVDALVNGFEIMEDGPYHWRRKDTQKKISAIPLKPKTNSATNSATNSKLPSFKKRLPTFKKKTEEPVKIMRQEDDDLYDEDSADEIDNSAKAKFFTEESNDSIEEDGLINEQDIATDVTMITCGKSKTKRKRACKDCSCGLKEQEEQEIDNIRKQQDSVIRFTEEELTEIDFTIEGKKVGGCGSCSLGDAFRCSGCPYLGLPAFKPGQQINLNSILDDL